MRTGNELINEIFIEPREKTRKYIFYLAIDYNVYFPFRVGFQNSHVF